MITGYGLIYTHQFTSAASGLLEQFRIYQRDLSDANTDIDAGPAPITTQRGGNADTANSQDLTVAYEQVTMQLMADSALFQYVNFANPDEELYLGVRLVWNGSAWEEKFRGFMSPEFYSQDLYHTPVLVNLGFTDRMGDLQNYDFVNDDIYDSSIHEGKKTQLYFITYALSRLNLEMQGIRVTTRLMESNINSAATDSAFAQIYTDPLSYYEQDDTGAISNTLNLLELLDHILKPYSATIYAWAGYYWIVEQQELNNASFSYVEYDMDGVYVANSTQSNSLSFKAEGSTNYWRWVGRQNLSFTPIYSQVKLDLNGNLKGSITVPFIGENVLTTANVFTTFGEDLFNNFFTIVKGNTLDSLSNVGNPYITDEDRQVIYYEGGGATLYTPEDKQQMLLTFSFRDTNISATFIRHIQEITHGAGTGDRMLIEIELEVRPSYSSGYTEPLSIWPFYVMPWVFKVGSYYYKSDTDTWTTSATTNYEFITKAGEPITVSLEFALRDVDETDDYELNVYIPTRFHNDLGNNTDTSEATMITALKNIGATTGLPGGTVRTVRYQSDSGLPRWEYYFYELIEGLAAGSEPVVVTPSDYNASTNDKRWQLVEQRSLLGIAAGGVTEIRGINTYFLPFGKDPTTPVTVKSAVNNNSVVLNSELNHFDAPSQVNSSELIYLNILYRLNIVLFVPTENWTDGTNTLKIQNHRMNWLNTKAKSLHHRITGASLITDTDLPPFLRYAVSDLSRNYLLLNASIDHKRGEVSGDMVEIKEASSVYLEMQDGIVEMFDGPIEMLG